MNLKIRRIRKNALGALAKLYEGFWNETSSLRKMEKAFDKIRKNRNQIILNAFDKNKLIGTLLAVICEELYGNCNPFAVIEDFIVDKSYRRQGVGRALMEKAEEILRTRKCNNVLLITERNRKDANGFYQSLGFPTGIHVGYKKPLIQKKFQ